MRSIPLLLLVLALAPLLRGQEAEVWIRGAAPAEVFFAGSRPVARIGRLLEIGAGDGAAARRIALPPDACAWDLAPVPGDATLALAWIEPRGLFARRLGGPDEAAVRLDEAGDLFRGRPDGGPVRLALLAAAGEGGLALLAPDRAGIRVRPLAGLGARPARPFDVPAPATSRQSLGWGLGYRMETELRVPSHRLVRRGDEDLLLVRRARDWRLVGADGKERPFGPAPRREEHKILDFDVAVPPIAADLDRDGRPDLLGFDPGRGLVLWYRGAKRGEGDEAPEPDQVLRVDGWILRAWVGDFDGDGRDDLALLQVPQLGLLEQVAVIKSGELPVRFDVRLLTAEGGFDETARHPLRADLPISLSLTRSGRRILPRLPVLPAVAPGRKPGLVFPDDEGRAVWWGLDGEGAWTSRRVLFEGRSDEIVAFSDAAALRPRAEGWDLLLARVVEGGAGRVERLRLDD
ncbi:MAG: FG-GAP-like repeat-containing protein [Planctomycetota bacterium]